MQKALKSSSLSSYLLKPSKSLTHGFENNRTAQEKLFKHMCNFGSRSEWRKGRSVISSYLDVESFQLQMGFSFPLLRDNDLRSSLLIIRARSFLLSCT